MNRLETMVGQTLGRYRLTRLLGRGAQGAVYHSWDEVLACDVAVKVLLPSLVLGPPVYNEFIDNFRNEARIIRRLRHTNIVSVHDFGIQDNIAYIVMTYAPEGALKDRLDKAGVLPVEDIADHLKQAAAALDYAHKLAKPIIHRDVKPQNFLLDGNTLMLADFGVAEMMMNSSEVTGSSLPTLANTNFAIVGTPAYLAPEVGRRERVDWRADIYSLGVMLYQMLCGHVPFNHPAGIWWTIAQHIHEAPPRLTQELTPIRKEFGEVVMQDVEDMVMQALEKAPKARYQSAGDLAKEFRACFGERCPKCGRFSRPLKKFCSHDREPLPQPTPGITIPLRKGTCPNYNPYSARPLALFEVLERCGWALKLGRRHGLFLHIGLTIWRQWRRGHRGNEEPFPCARPIDR